MSNDRKGQVFNQPSQIMVELAELLTTNINFADWSVFAKNGSDLTTWAIRVAREETGRPFVVKAKGAYHGVDAWCDPGFGGRVENDRSHVLEFSWNNLDEFRSLLENYRNQISSVILTPYHHAAFGPSILPDHNFWPVVEEECKKNGIILILDDVRAGGAFGMIAVPTDILISHLIYRYILKRWGMVFQFLLVLVRNF